MERLKIKLRDRRSVAAIMALSSFLACVFQYVYVSPAFLPLVLATGLAFTVLARALIVDAAQPVPRALSFDTSFDANLLTLFEYSPDATLITGADGKIKYANPSVYYLLGQKRERLIGTPLQTLFEAQDRHLIEQDFEKTKTLKKGHLATQWRLRRSDGSIAHTEAMLTALARDAPQEIVLSLRDASAHHALTTRLRQQALYDDLTELANRTLFCERLEHLLGTEAQGVRHVAILFIDVDQFNHVNDGFGQHSGDQLLKSIAERLRTITPLANVVARLSGDEFALVQIAGINAASIYATAETIAKELGKPFGLEDRIVELSVSVGIVFAKPGDSVDKLLSRADAAVHAAKRAGGNRIQVFDHSIEYELHRRVNVLSQLRKALERDELELFYQPMLRSGGKELFGVEALLRCPSFEKPVPTDLVIGEAERSGLIGPLGRWVIKRAMRDILPWIKASQDRLGAAPPVLSINLSWRQLDDMDLPDMIADQIRDLSFPPECLMFEITETGEPLNNADHPIVIQRIKALGIRFAVDDFGTGLSSFSTLMDLDIDFMKIPKAAVDGIKQDSAEAPIIQALLALAKRLKMNTIAEGVETATQANYLNRQGCDMVQGYHFARPMPLGALHEWLKSTRQRQVA